MLKNKSMKISFEFYPPKNNIDNINLLNTAKKFLQYNPFFYSVTFGANGSNQKKTYDIVDMLYNSNLSVAPHISCIGSFEKISNLIQCYKKKGIKHLVVLRGDISYKNKKKLIYEKGKKFFHASDLVKFIRIETGNYFHISIAAYPEYHPESRNPNIDLKYFIYKNNQGANQAITQFFFNSDAYFYFIENCKKHNVTTDIIPGIMPITNYKKLAIFSNKCHAEIPKWIREKLFFLEEKGDQIGLQKFGEKVITLLCENLLKNGAPGLHFYTLNQFEPTYSILRNLV